MKSMIEIKELNKNFGKDQILSDINFTIKDGEVFGLIGTNGAGKSTLLRTITGIYKPNSGTVTVDGLPVYDNPKAKQLFFFLPDDLYFSQGMTPKSLATYYKGIYPAFDIEKYMKLLDQFHLKPKKRISTYSKGMKRQVAILAGICANTKYVLLDESFDGLDPVIRKAVKQLLVREMDERGMTTIITSHNLREQEDICDHIGVLHQSKIVLSKDMVALKCSVQNVEVCFASDTEAEQTLAKLCIKKQKQKGPLYLLTIEGNREEVMEILHSVDTTYLDVQSLSLEDIFIKEMEAIGYDIQTFMGE